MLKSTLLVSICFLPPGMHSFTHRGSLLSSLKHFLQAFSVSRAATFVIAENSHSNQWTCARTQPGNRLPEREPLQLAGFARLPLSGHLSCPKRTTGVTRGWMEYEHRCSCETAGRGHHELVAFLSTRGAFSRSVSL